jgi:thiol-disulfide isomerase/thioredoxin
MIKKFFLSLLFLIIYHGNAFCASYSGVNLEVVDIDGKVFDINDHKNKAVLVLFWAQWCNYCRKEMVHLDEVYQQYKDQGLEIIALSIDSKKNQEKMVNFARRFSYRSAFFEDAKTSFSNSKNVVPLIQIVDKKRTVIYSLTGYVEKDEIINAVVKALK